MTKTKCTYLGILNICQKPKIKSFKYNCSILFPTIKGFIFLKVVSHSYTYSKNKMFIII